MAASGRPRKADGERPSRHVRVFEDMAEMVKWIGRVEGIGAAQLLDPLIRAPITARYKRIEKDVKKIIKAEQDAAASAKGEPGSG